MPAEVRHHFPECLILGPQQLEIIISDCNRSLIMGDVGTGKTMVILTLLYKYTAKCLSQLDNPEYKKVLLLIPDDRKEFRKYVTKFIHQHCNEGYIYFPNDRIIVDGNFVSLNKIEVILADEIHDFNFLDLVIPSLTKKICLNRPSLKVCITFMSPFGEKPSFLIRDNITYHINFFNEFQRFELHQMYRNPVNIATRVFKIRRRGITLLPSLNLPLKLGVTVMQEDSIEIKPFSTIEEIVAAIPKKRFKNERMLAVTDDLLHQLPMTVLEEYDCVTSLYRYRIFSGFEYHSVTVIFGKTKRPRFRRKLGTLFHAISRVTSRFVIICHKKLENYFHDLLELGPVDTLVLEKLRRGKKVEPEDYPLLETDEDKMAALSILIQTNNTEQYKEMQSRNGSNSVVFDDAFLNQRIAEYIKFTVFTQRFIIFSKEARVLDPVIKTLVKDAFRPIRSMGGPFLIPVFSSYRENYLCLYDVIPGVNDWGSLIAYAALSIETGDNYMRRICALEALRLLAIMKEVFGKLVKRTCSKMHSNQKTSGGSIDTVKKCYEIGQKLLKFRIAAEWLQYIGDAKRLEYCKREEKRLCENCYSDFCPNERRFLQEVLSTAEEREIVFTTEAHRESFDLIVTMLQSIVPRMEITQSSQSSTYEDDSWWSFSSEEENEQQQQQGEEGEEV